MEQYKHELEQIDMSKADKTKTERLLNSKEHTQFRGGVGSLGWFHCCPQLSFQLAELRRKQALRTVSHGASLVFLSPTANLYDAKQKEGAAPASTDKRLAIALAIVKAKAVSGETDLRWIDARYQITDCLTKHASRKSEAVPQ